MFANFAALIDTKDKAVQAFEKFGWKFLDCPQSYGALGEADWRPVRPEAEGLRRRGRQLRGHAVPELPRTCSTAPHSSTTSRSGTPRPTCTTRCSPSGTPTATATSVYVRLAFTPFEEADQNKATKQYQDLVEESGGDTALLGDAGHVELPLVGDRDQGVRVGGHPSVRARQPEEDHEVDRRAGCTPRPTRARTWARRVAW